MSNDTTIRNEQLLIEIVSAWDLPCSDVRSRNDPYVSVVHHRRSTNRGEGVSPGDQGSGGSGSASAVHVHQTDHVSNSADPVWTVRSGSLFLLQIPRRTGGNRNKSGEQGARDVADDEDDDDAVIDGSVDVDGELLFEVKDYDPLLAGGGDDLLGFATVPISVLRRGVGERSEFELLAPTTPKRQLELKSETSETIADVSTDEEEQAVALIGGSGDDDQAVKVGLTQRLQPSASGKLALRFRPATEEDAKFVQALRDGDDLHLCSFGGSNGCSAGRDVSSSITNRLFKGSMNKGAVRVNEANGETEILVRPYPDPARPPSETEYLTEAQIDNKAFQEPSRAWVEAAYPPSDDAPRQQPLGKIHLEILGCDDLTDMDRSANILSSSRRAAEKTDAFVQIVYKDFAVRTDVVPDCLCPRWLPWTRRAVVLPLIRPSSSIFLAVLDHDEDNVVVSNHHDFIGRVTLDVGGGRFVPDTVYTLQYDLHTSDLVRVASDDDNEKVGGDYRGRAKNGTITVRLRIELLPGTTERGFFISSLRPPPTGWNLHVPTKKDRWAIKCAVEGEVDVNKFNLATTSSYVDELLAYKEVLAYLQDAAASLLFWRGHYRVHLWVPWCNCCSVQRGEGSNSSCPSSHALDSSRDRFFSEKLGQGSNYLDRFRKKITVSLPLHSMGAFASGVILVERPHFFPSFISALAAWVLLGVGGHRRNHPSPWEHCRSYRELFLAFLWGSSFSQTIAPYENEKAIREHENLRREQVKGTTTVVKDSPEDRRMEKETTQSEEQPGETRVQAPTNNACAGTGISLNPLEPLLSPLQRALGSLCRALRLIRNVIIWDECFVTFWLTTACLAGAVIFAFVPWGLMVHWTARIIVRVFLGPWMWLVDKYYLRRTATPAHIQRMQLQAVPDGQVRYQRSGTKTDDARMAREATLKLKDMKSCMFGKYVVKVPGISFDRFRCTPCPASNAKPYDESISSNSSSWLESDNIMVLGQRISGGDMIPATTFGISNASVATQKCNGELTPLTSEGQAETYSSIPKADAPSSDTELMSKRERLKSQFRSKFSWIHGHE